MADTQVTLVPAAVDPVFIVGNGPQATDWLVWDPLQGDLLTSVTDGSDVSAVTPYPRNSQDPIAYRLPSYTLPDRAIIRYLTVRCRVADTNLNVNNRGLARMTFYDSSIGSNTQLTGDGEKTPPSTIVAGGTDWIESQDSTTKLTGPWTATDLTHLGVNINPFALGAAISGLFLLYEVRAVITINQAPTVTVTGPSGTQTGTSYPTATWNYADPEGDVQERAWVKIFARNGSTPAGFDPDTGHYTGDNGIPLTPIFDSGETFSASAQKVSTVALPNGQYTVFVKAADIGSSGRYSAWSSSDFTQNVPGPNAPTLTAAPDPTRARVGLTMTAAGTGPTTSFFTLQRSDDFGTTWANVWGGGADISGDGGTLTFYDRTAPREQTLLYRAMGLHTVSAGVDLAGTWSTWPQTVLSSDGNDWIHSSSTPALDTAVLIQGPNLAGLSHEDQAVYWPEGRTHPVIIGGTVHSEYFDQASGATRLTFFFTSDAAWKNFVTIRNKQEPVLIRTQYGDTGGLEQYWCRLGADVSTTRLGGGFVQQRTGQFRSVVVAAYPVDTPVGLTATIAVATTTGGTPVSGTAAGARNATTLRGGISLRGSAGQTTTTSPPPVSTPLPTNRALPTIAGPAVVGQTLTAQAGTWTNVTSFAYQWRRDGANVVGAASPTYLLTSADIGHAITVAVTGINSTGSVTVVSAATPTVTTTSAQNPTVTSLPTVSGTTQVGQILTATNGQWTNSPRTFAYQWQRDGTTNIAAATSQSYTLVSGDVGHTINVVVTATNTVGSGTASSAATATVTAASGSEILDANTAGMETDATGWSTNGHCSKAQSTTVAHGGTHSLAVTFTNDSNFFDQVITTAFYAVTAGTSYTASGWAYTGTAGRSAHLTFQWFQNDQLTVIANQDGPNTDLTVNGWTQVSTGLMAAPSGAAYVRIIAMYMNSATWTTLNTSEVHYYDDFSLKPSGVNPPPSSGSTVNTIDQIVYSMNGAHESPPHGVPSNWSWGLGPELDNPRPPAGQFYCTTWGQYYEASEGTGSTNTAVNFRWQEGWVLLASTGQWTRILSEQNLGGGERLPEPFDENNNSPWGPYLRYESDGTLTIFPSSGHLFHFWDASRASINPGDVLAFFSTVQARLVLIDPNGTDDRSLARFVVNMGWDWWPSLDGGTGNAQGCEGRFMYVTTQWRAFNAWAGPADLAGQTNGHAPWSIYAGWNTNGALTEAQMRSNYPTLR